MNPAGAVLIIAGVWVLAQVLKGDALGRLGIVAPAAGAAPAVTAPAAPAPGGTVSV